MIETETVREVVEAGRESEPERVSTVLPLPVVVVPPLAEVAAVPPLPVVVVPPLAEVAASSVIVTDEAVEIFPQASLNHP